MTPSVRNIVALLPLERSYRSVFLPLLGLLYLALRAQACEAVNSRVLYRLKLRAYSFFLHFSSKKAGLNLSKPALCIGVVLSFRAASSQVFSALMSLTTVFGMGTGGPSLPLTPILLHRHFSCSTQLISKANCFAFFNFFGDP